MEKLALQGKFAQTEIITQVVEIRWLKFKVLSLNHEEKNKKEYFNVYLKWNGC